MEQGAMASLEKMVQPLFTQGEGMKRDKGETLLWNHDGRQFLQVQKRHERKSATIWKR